MSLPAVSRASKLEKKNEKEEEEEESKEGKIKSSISLGWTNGYVLLVQSRAEEKSS